MSARVSRGPPPRGAGRCPQQMKRAFDLNLPQVDLNVPPPADQSNDVGTSADAPVVIERRVGQQTVPPPPVMIDVDSIDDDVVVLSSPSAFAEAKNGSRRNQNRSNVVDVELEFGSRQAANNHNKRQRIPVNQPIINCESYVAVQRNSNSLNGIGRSKLFRMPPAAAPPPPPPPPPPPEPTFSCPVCMGPLAEEMSTKCGHIFCKACIKKAISVQGKCPTCRRKVTMKDTIRIYLPKTS